jgi:hypothetical protein
MEMQDENVLGRQSLQRFLLASRRYFAAPLGNETQSLAQRQSAGHALFRPEKPRAPSDREFARSGVVRTLPTRVRLA